MPSDYTRIHRLLRILTLIQGETGWTAKKLAEQCSVDVRTIYRDMKTLEGAGIPYSHNPQTKGYEIRKDFFMPPVSLTLDESLSLVALGEQIGRSEQVPMTHAAGKAIEKIRTQLPARIREELANLDGHLAIDLARRGPVEGIRDVYTHVRAALTQKRVLRCSYESINASLRGGDDGEIFELRPYALVFSQRAWYVVGHHGGRGEVRNLKLNRFTSIEMTGKPYGIPDDFKLTDHLGNAWRMIRGKKTYNVELVFDKLFAETVADTHWHPTQRYDWHEDGSMTFKCQVDGLDEIVWWVLSMGPHCQVIKPKALAERVKQLAEGIVEQYGEDAPKQSKRSTKRNETETAGAEAAGA